MHIRPKRLGTRQSGIKRRDDQCAPQIRRRPAIGKQFRGGSERERGWEIKRAEVDEEEPAVGDDLSFVFKVVVGTRG